MSLRKEIEHRRASLPPASSRCYLTSEKAVCLCIVLKDGTDWIFPWKNLSYACHQTETNRESLALAFIGGEVVIQGWNLEPLSDAAACLQLSEISEIPAAYRDPKDSEPFVSQISVRETGDVDTD